MAKFREKILASGAHIILGRDKESNEELVKKFQGKSNKIFHTAARGSPFCVIDKSVSDEDVYATAVICARYSQDWRNNKKDVKVNVFTGKDVYKSEKMLIGAFGVKKSKSVVVKKSDILKLLK